MNLELSVSLHFNGNAEAAFRFYERCLGCKIPMLLTWGNSPMAKDAPPEWQRKLLHASLPIGDFVLTGGDVLPANYRKPQGFGLQLNTPDVAAGRRIFEALSENGTILVPLQETFWAPLYGCLTDQFGIQWEINCEK